MCGKAEGVLPYIIDSAAGESGDVVAVLDPPRTGLAPAVCKALRQERAIKRVVYVSCNPHGYTLRHDYVVRGGSLASQAKLLCEARGRARPFRLVRCTPLDLFPHTPHCELVVTFERG